MPKLNFYLICAGGFGGGRTGGTAGSVFFGGSGEALHAAAAGMLRERKESAISASRCFGFRPTFGVGGGRRVGGVGGAVCSVGDKECVAIEAR